MFLIQISPKKQSPFTIILLCHEKDAKNGLNVTSILESAPDNFHPYVADLNGDKTISVTDVQELIPIVLFAEEEEEEETNSFKPQVNSRESMTSTMTLKAKGNEVSLLLDNDEPFTACQMIVTLPKGCTLIDARLGDERADGHTVAVGDLGNGRYSVMIYTLNGRQLRNNRSPLLFLDVEGKRGGLVAVSDIHFTNKQFETVDLPNTNCVATDIGAVTADESDASFYNLQGIKTRTPNRGVFIQNGHKVVVK